MILSMFNQDFSEERSTIHNVETWSQEDFKFLKVMNEKVEFKDGHYILPLPLRNHEIKLPNNRTKKNQRMFEDYKIFMANIIEKGYAEQVKNSPRSEGEYGTYHITGCITQRNQIKSVSFLTAVRSIKGFR